MKLHASRSVPFIRAVIPDDLDHGTPRFQSSRPSSQERTHIVSPRAIARDFQGNVAFIEEDDDPEYRRCDFIVSSPSDLATNGYEDVIFTDVARQRSTND